MTESYTLWKTAHILSATILFGTGLGTAFFCWFGYRHAMRTGEIAVLRAVLRLTVIADYCFTAPAVVFQAASGLMLMSILGWPWISPWSGFVYVLYIVVGLCWLPVVVLQIRLSRAAEQAPAIAALPSQTHAWFRWWFTLGIPAFAAMILMFWLMVAKPMPVAGS